MTAADIRFMLFGLLVTLGSTFGQTYFFGALQPEIRAEYGLTEAQFARIYLLVTLGSAIGVSVFGGAVDRIALPRYITILTGSLVAGVLGMVFMEPLMLFAIAMLAARLTGQGLFVHAAMSSMSRYFDRLRGRAIAVSTMGISIGQAVFPLMLVSLMQNYGWREAMLILIVGFAALVYPVMMLMLKGHTCRHQRWQRQQEIREQQAATIGDRQTHTALEPRRSFRRADMLKDWRFYAVIPILIIVPFWVTALFFFADQLAELKGLTLSELTSTYFAYAIAAALAPFAAGSLVDRFGARNILLVPTISLAVAHGVLIWTDLPMTVFMILFGIAGSVSIPIMNTLWAELYGTRYIGEIKGVSNAVMVLSTAMAPFLLGEFLTRGVGFSVLVESSAWHMAVATLAAFALLKRGAR